MSESTSARLIGGESGHRGFLGLGIGQNPIRWALVALFGGGGVLLAPIAGIWSLVIGGVLAGAAWLVTARTARGSIFSRARRKRRWRRRVAEGTDSYLPFTDENWQAANEVLASARGRKAKAEARRELAALRVMPDGADGMGWLQSGHRMPGIAWQVPIGEEARLTVAFELPGQLRGLATAERIGKNAAAFGQFLASRASTLIRQVQIITHVLPTDATLYEQWIAVSSDPDAPAQLRDSYAEAVVASAEGTTQRHYLVCTWPLDGEFDSQAARFGESRDGWRGLMTEEIAAVERDLNAAGYEGAHALSARQLTAVVRHMQNPSRPLDFVGDVDPARLGEASRDQFSAHVVGGTDPSTGEHVTWWHRTARVVPEQMVASLRTPLWHLPLFLSNRLRSIRSVAWNIELVPADVARARTREDLTNDQAEAIAAAQAGRVDDGSGELRGSAAQVRARDLRPGTGHHGTYWAGYMTVSARSKSELVRACRDLETLCRMELDIPLVEWMDSYQSAASGTTWPLGRGLRPQNRTGYERLSGVLGGKADKDAIS